MSEPKDRKQETVHEDSTTQPPRTFRAEELFCGGQEVWIEHSGVRYRLRITRRNKLILQK
jgi:hemin uptake protein HemP